MPTPADHFTALVDRLVARDGGAVDAEPDPLLDRLARACAGESPARLRGRILLERAAYLMVSTDRTLLDIALDSGFARQDVFTRAFRREHGVLPSVWRADPTGCEIDAATDVHFRAPAGLRLPARHRMDGVDLVIEMVEHHVRLLGEVVDRAGSTADADPTLRRSLSGLVDQLEAANAVLRDSEGDGDGDGDGDDLAAIRRRLDRAGPELVDHVTRLAATGRFDETVVDAFSPTPRVRSYGAVVAHVLTSAAHDRLLALVPRPEAGRP